MADFCADCTVATFPNAPAGAHDLPAGRGWWLCEGCGAHIFLDGRRQCATPQLRAEARAWDDACATCLDLARTMPL